MRIIQFKDLPKDRGSMADSELSNRFLQALSAKNLDHSSIDELSVDLSAPGWMSPSEIVMLACWIRKAAEGGIFCSITLPEKENSTFVWTLESFRFPQALGATSKTESWQQRVNFENYTPLGQRAHSFSETRRVIPLSWLDKSTFNQNSSNNNLYLVEPEFNQEYVDFVSRVLARHGFVAQDAIDDFIRGILRELGWNAVLHSIEGQSWGFAAFAGQVFEKGRFLEIALADAGCGIAANLVPHYRSALLNREIQNYERIFSCNESAASVRFAFDAFSTSRTEFSSKYEEHHDRGLALVSEIAQESGTLVVVSSGCVVSVQAKTAEKFSVSQQNSPSLGTCFYVKLSGNRELVSKPKASKMSRFEETWTEADIVSAAPILARETKQILKVAQRLLRKLKTRYSHSIVDLGFLDKSAKLVEAGIALYVETVRPTSLSLMNVRSPRISPNRIKQGLQQIGFDSAITIRIINPGEDSKEISFQGSDINANEKLRWRRTKSTTATICGIQFRATSVFLEESFGLLGPDSGFYEGRIHLLSGKVADKYFSLVAHTQTKNGNNKTRWLTAFRCLLKMALSNSIGEKTKVFGFAASMQPMLDALQKFNFQKDGKPHEITSYCLLSYDAPSKAELAEIIKAGDEIVLCTDVISTASLLHELIKLVRRIGAKVTTIISLVDARNPHSDTWRDVIEKEVTGIPLLLVSSLKRQFEQPGEQFEGPEYWVDPVSAVPVQNPPESLINIEKVSQTVDLLISTSSIAVGHFVSGLRHTSVRINMPKLFSESELIFRRTESEWLKLKRQKEWTKFKPKIALVPAGIDRIHLLGSSTNKSIIDGPTSESYADIVVGLFQRPPRIISIPRTFEPGGQAKCAAIDYMAENYDLTDVVIVDDGISTGGTVRSLISQAVRAGSKRILAVTLLARTNLEELGHWQLTHEVSDGRNGDHALVSLIYPLHLPIPFTGEVDCPQCATLASLRSRGIRGESISKGWHAIETDLGSPTDYVPSLNKPEYFHSWLFVHSFSELASQSTEAFGRLSKYLAGLEKGGSSKQLEREAVLRLFLIEWRLLSRSRLRQVIRLTVRNLALDQLSSPETDEQRIVESLSLIRSMFGEEYLQIIREHLPKIVNSEAILDRVLFHLDTLDSIGFEVETNSVIRELTMALEQASQVDSGSKSKHSQILERLTSELVHPKQSNDVVSNIQLLRHALSSSKVLHDVVGTLLEVSKIKPIQLQELKATDYFKLLAEQIDEVLIPALESEVYPQLQGLEELLGVQLNQRKFIGKIEPTYFEKIPRDNTTCLSRDITSIRDALENVNSGLGSVQELKVAQLASKNALNIALLPTSALTEILDSLVCKSVSDIFSFLSDSLHGFLANGNVDIDDKIYGDESRNGGQAIVVCPQSFLTTFVMLVKRNLEKHVLTKIPKSAIEVSISAGFQMTAKKSYVVFQIANNGPPIDDGAWPKFRSRQFDQQLDKLVVRPISSAHDLGNLSFSSGDL